MSSLGLAAFGQHRSYNWRLLYTFQAPSSTDTTAAYGSHSFLTIATPTNRRHEGIYTPLIYCGDKKEAGLIWWAEDMFSSCKIRERVQFCSCRPSNIVCAAQQNLDWVTVRTFSFDVNNPCILAILIDKRAPYCTPGPLMCNLTEGYRSHRFSCVFLDLLDLYRSSRLFSTWNHSRTLFLLHDRAPVIRLAVRNYSMHYW